jgi:hypothetical protein
MRARPQGGVGPSFLKVRLEMRFDGGLDCTCLDTIETDVDASIAINVPHTT